MPENKKNKELTAEIEDKDKSDNTAEVIISKLEKISYKPIEKLISKQLKEKHIQKTVEKAIAKDEKEIIELEKPTPKPIELKKIDSELKNEILVIATPFFGIFNSLISKYGIVKLSETEQSEILDLIFEKMFADKGKEIMKTVANHSTDIKILVFIAKSILPRILAFVLQLKPK